MHGWRSGIFCVRADYTARIDAIAEEADDSEQFIVTKAGICGGLEDEVGSFVDGVAVGVESVIETTASAGSVDEKVSSLGGRGA